MTLTLFDPECHALAVDVTDLERHHFADAESRAIGHGQGSLVLEIAGCLDQARHFLPTQYDRQGARQVYWLHAGHDFGVIEGDVKEELQAADGGIQRRRRNPFIDEMQLVAT
jgi:hypothetical protein